MSVYSLMFLDAYATIVTNDMIKSLSLTQEADPTMTTCPTDAFTVEVCDLTIDPTGIDVILRVDGNNWGQFFVSDVEPERGNMVKLICKSLLYKLDRIMVAATYYPSGTTFYSAISALMPAAFSYTFDSSVINIRLQGYCPQQSVRERIQQICFATCTTVRTAYFTSMRFVPAAVTTTVLIPPENVYAFPTTTQAAPVTSIMVAYYILYTYDPGAADGTVVVGSTTYWYVKMLYTLQNSNIPAGATENIIKYDGGMLVNSTNAPTIALNLARVFDQGKLSARVIWDASAQIAQWAQSLSVGGRFSIPIDGTRVFTGTLTSCRFSFGARQAADITVQYGKFPTPLYTYTIQRACDGYNIGNKPIVSEGNAFCVITNPVINHRAGTTRLVALPPTPKATITTPASNSSMTQTYTKAATQDTTTKDVSIYAVDTATATGGELTIG